MRARLAALSKPSRADLLATALAVLLVAACFADVIAGGSCFFVRDLTRYYFPTKSVIHRIVASGELPLWNPYYSGGQPALANPEYEIFYPGQWLIFLPDFFLGFRLHILLHFIVGALGMYALMRSLNARAGVALLTAITFVLSGPFLSSTNLLTTLFPLAWFPWCLLFSRRYVHGRTRGDLALASLCFAMVLLIFEPGNVVQIAVICIGYSWYAGVRSGKRFGPVGATLLPLILATAIAAVQLLPTLDFIRHTARSAGMSYDMIATWSLPPVRLFELLQPHFLGRNPFLSSDYWGGFLYGAQGGPYFQSLYLGLLPLVALISGVVRRDRRTLAAVAGAAALLVVCIGDHTPLLRLAYLAKLPLALRFPERFATGAAFLLILAAGLATQRIIDDAAWRATSLRVTVALVGLTVIVTAFVFSRAGAGVFAEWWRLSPEVIVRSLALARVDWLNTCWRAGLLCAVLYGMRWRRSYAIVLPVLFVVIDLVPLVNEVAPRMPRRFFEAPPVVQELRGASHASRIFFHPEWSTGAVMRGYNSERSTIYWVTRNGLFPRLPAAWGLSTILERDIDLTNLRPSADFLDAFWQHPPRDPAAFVPWAAMANVEWFAALRPPQPSLQDPTLTRPVAFVPLGQNPRYYFADEVVRIQSLADFANQVVSNRHSRHAAYVTSPVVTAGSGSVVRFDESANHISIDAVTPASALLVASVTRDDHWQATVDGRPIAILPVNVGFQGVMVAPGRHRIEFSYRNRLFACGLFISGLALVLTFFFLFARHDDLASVNAAA